MTIDANLIEGFKFGFAAGVIASLILFAIGFFAAAYLWRS